MSLPPWPEGVGCSLLLVACDGDPAVHFVVGALDRIAMRQPGADTSYPPSSDWRATRSFETRDTLTVCGREVVDCHPGLTDPLCPACLAGQAEALHRAADRLVRRRSSE